MYDQDPVCHTNSLTELGLLEACTPPMSPRREFLMTVTPEPLTPNSHGPRSHTAQALRDTPVTPNRRPHQVTDDRGDEERHLRPKCGADLFAEPQIHTPKRPQEHLFVPKTPKRMLIREPRSVKPPQVIGSDDYFHSGLLRSILIPACSRPTANCGGFTLSSKSLNAPGRASTPKSQYDELFEELEHLGDGSFGTVHKVRSRADGQVYAVKKICTRQPMATRLQEARAMQACAGHPNVVRLHCSWVEGPTLFLQMEYYEGGSVTQMHPLGSLFWTETALTGLLRQVAAALTAVHAAGWAHLDVKPENIYCRGAGADEVVVLGDFGLACNAPPCQAEGAYQPIDCEGDSRYLCPFLLNSPKYPQQADVFSLGASIYELARGVPLPLSGPEWHKIRRGELTGIDHLTSPMRVLLKKMLDPDPVSRPTAADLVRLCMTDGDCPSPSCDPILVSSNGI